MLEITFKTFQKIQESGKTNMMDIKKVIELSNNKLTKEDCLDIMENYSEYESEFGSSEE